TLPIRGIAGDQQAALFAAGGAKATYGTGSFILVETEEEPGGGVLRTAAARLEGEEPRRALEGAVFVTGAAIQWLRDGLGLLGDPVEPAREPEQTALGAALLALAERRPSPAGEIFEPQHRDAERLYAGWREALRRTV